MGRHVCIAIAQTHNRVPSMLKKVSSDMRFSQRWNVTLWSLPSGQGIHRKKTLVTV
jgi:hypothetical protein